MITASVLKELSLSKLAATITIFAVLGLDAHFTSEYFIIKRIYHNRSSQTFKNPQFSLIYKFPIFFQHLRKFSFLNDIWFLSYFKLKF